MKPILGGRRVGSPAAQSARSSGSHDDSSGEAGQPGDEARAPTGSSAAQGRLAAIEALIVQCEEGPPDYNEWPWDSTIKAARAAFDALVKEAE